ncbi:hypothetical protein HUU42_03725 [bacterium]|nr:hypothetical protein [bacterium]
MKLIRVATVACAVFALVQTLKAQTGNVSAMTDRFGSFYNYSAQTLDFGDLYVFQNTRFFKGNADRFDGTATTSRSVKDVNAVLGLQFGIAHNLDMVFLTNFYQTPNRAPSIPPSAIVSFFKDHDVPNDFLLNFRYVPYSFSKDKFKIGFMGTFKWKSENFPNAPFQVYATDKAEAGFSVVTSLIESPKVPETGYIFNFNLQYWNHLDKGQYVGFTREDSVRRAANGNALADAAVSTGNTSSLRFGVGGSYPIMVADKYLYIMADVYGLMYMTKPPEAAYSRQDYAFAAVGVKYQFFDWLALHLGGEFQVLKKKDPTSSSTITGIEDLTVSGSDYPSWRIFTGLSMPLSPRALSFKPEDETVSVDRETQKKREVENILYSEQEIQKRSVNFIPVRDMRKQYKDIVGGLVNVLQPWDKKPVEEEFPVEESTEEKKETDEGGN